MKVKKRIIVPTGSILLETGEKGKLLETLSLADYGKEHNVKADFLGLTKDIEGVPNDLEPMPLEKKWVVTLSSQYGCSMGCKFCSVPLVGPGINATYQDLKNQVLAAIQIHPEVEHTERLNIHYARCGEPSFNYNVLISAIKLRGDIYPHLGTSHIHPVISTMMPKKNKDLLSFLLDWTKVIKNDFYEGEAGMQFSINSTNNAQRDDMFSGSSLSLEDISIIGEILPFPVGRKYALNFALADGYEIDAEALFCLFDPEKFMVKITPIHKTQACVSNGIKTTGGYEYFTPYKQAEEDLKAVGFDVLVFIPSLDEDLGKITCGNAILSGEMPETEYKETIFR